MIATTGAVFAALYLLVAGFQIALALGAPWGHLAMGGRWPGRLPPAMRGLAGVQAGLILGVGWITLGHSGWISTGLPGWTIWLAVGLSALTTLANLATPSRPERRLWAPVAVALLICALAVAFGAG